MRKYTKKEKRYDKIRGHGFLAKVIRVRETAETRAKKSRLAGKVLKIYRGQVNAKEGVRLKRMTSTYIRLCSIAGISTLETRIVLAPTKQGAYRINAVQPFIEKQNILNNYLKHCTKQEAISIIGEMINYCKKMKTANELFKDKIGLDVKPSNFAIINGKLVLIDLFPPLLKDNEEITTLDVSKHYKNFFLRTTTKAFPKTWNKIVSKISEYLFDYHKSLNYLELTYSNTRPDIVKEIHALVKDAKRTN